MATTIKPESALKRADGTEDPESIVHRLLANVLTLCFVELISVGQKSVALDVLHGALSNRRRNDVWQKVYEDLVLKFIELCVELRSSKHAKDGLIQYRFICQTVNISSLEMVIKQLLELTQKAAEEAKAKAGLTTLDIEDLDAEETAESLLTTGSAEHKELSDRENVNRWLKFQWETFRNVLDILRLNAKLEPLYQVRRVIGNAFSDSESHPSQYRTRHSRRSASARHTSARPSTAGCATSCARI
jgi:hypothetical protein